MTTARETLWKVLKVCPHRAEAQVAGCAIEVWHLSAGPTLPAGYVVRLEVAPGQRVWAHGLHRFLGGRPPTPALAAALARMARRFDSAADAKRAAEALALAWGARFESADAGVAS